MTRFLLAVCFCCGCFALSAQLSPFQFYSASQDEQETIHGQTAELDLAAIRTELREAPRELTGAKSTTIISLPLPNGEFAEFTAYDSPLLKGHKDINSYRMFGPWGVGRLAASWKGISAVLRGPDGYFIIEPIDNEASTYRISDYGDFMERTAETQGPLSCGFDDSHSHSPDYGGLEIDPELKGEDAGAIAVGKAGNEPRELRVYDLIMTNTGDFARQVGGDTMDVLEAFNTAVSTINGIFETEVGIRINLIEVRGLVYLDPNTDPFSNPREGAGLLGQIIGAFTANGIPPNSYDLGHIFTVGCNNGLGGVVSGSACTGGKTRGVTCVGGTVVGAALRIMAHEVAHQFAVSHSWNNCPTSQPQRASNTSFEPGSGTTIMSYAGACESENIGSEEPYYHVGSLQQFLFYTREGGARNCATVIETDNLTPVVELAYDNGFFIPISTPFRLEGTATDANNDNLFYNWEQYDLGPASGIREPRGNAPIFRSFRPTASGNVRYFPRLDRIVNNISSLAEVLPTYTRDLTFRLTARDNNAEAGGVDWEQVAFHATEEAGPFVVNDPTSTSWRVGEYQEVTWEVANTDQAPVNCKRVNVRLSLNGGQNFDVVLAENVPNTGSAFVTVPEAAITSSALLMIEAADNVFLNINDGQFTVEEAIVPAFTLDPSSRYEAVCLPTTVTVDLNSGSVLDFSNEISLSLDEGSLPAGATASLSEEAINPGESSTLSVDLSDVRFSGRLALTVIAVAEGQDTARREILLDVTDNDYADLMTTAPAEGTAGIILSTDFDWTDAINADSYSIQIATSPTFAPETIVEEASNLTDSDYIPADFFEPNTLFFWRIRPANICGEGDWLDPNSFRTVSSECTTYTGTDTPITLPGSGPSFMRESEIFVEDQGTIDDVNLPNVDIRYNFVSVLTVTLVSPDATRVVLYDRSCRISTNRLDLGFDDEAPLGIGCPPDDQRVFRPAGTLADFNGEDIFGTWTLEVAVSETGGSVGAIDSWDIEFCAAVSPVAPERAINTATEVPPLMKNTILDDKLLHTSAAFDNGDITYTITALPTEGRLLLYNNEITVGSVFAQDDINGAGLFYENTSGVEGTDDFGFVVTTPDGGYLAIDYHDIIIDENAIVSNRNVSPLDAGLSVFPNPVSEQLSVRWTAEVNRSLTLELFDINGRLLQQRVVAGSAQAAELRTDALSAGVYLLRVDGAVRRIVKK